MSHPRIEDLSFAEVWAALGGGPLRAGRGRAFWRGGDGFNVSIDAERRRWYDHARAEGGGILRLVETALGVNRRAALAWLGDNFGVGTTERTPEERRRFAQRIDAARAVAAQLVERRDAYMLDLRTAASILLTAYHQRRAEAEALHDIDLLAHAEDIYAKQEEITARHERLANATGPQLAELFAEFDRRVA
ncbi:MAG: hypothetical protein FJW38_23470 [Acidobacteria bacterium]|nr:hypothetical protein [Acidobacteriota bacterium]